MDQNVQLNAQNEIFERQLYAQINILELLSESE